MKPGYQTTEYWITSLYTLLTLVNQAGFLGHPLNVPAIMAIAAPVITYAVTRSGMKAFAQFMDIKPVDDKKLNS